MHGSAKSADSLGPPGARPGLAASEPIQRKATAATDLARPSLRRVGPPPLRPGRGLRRPGLRPWTRATLGCPADHRDHRTPEATRPAEGSLRDGTPAQPGANRASGEI